jgi:hypothetical protein
VSLFFVNFVLFMVKKSETTKQTKAETRPVGSVFLIPINENTLATARVFALRAILNTGC